MLRLHRTCRMSRLPLTLYTVLSCRVRTSRLALLYTLYTVSSCMSAQHPNVQWSKYYQMWVGEASNVLERAPNGSASRVRTSYFDDKDECIKATIALKKSIVATYWSSRQALADIDPTTVELPLGPDNASSAAANAIYYRPNKKDKHTPRRVVPIQKAGRVLWVRSCHHGIGTAACGNVAQSTQFCVKHSKHIVQGQQSFDDFCLELVVSLVTCNR